MVERLKELKPGERAVVVGYENSEPLYLNKILAMGLTKGIELTLTKVAPLGDPVEIMVRGYSLSLRKAEADVLQVRRSK
ncbi:MAG: FeoA family protein [Bacillota bacterium]|jgi:ferrous iron transport protein A